MHQDNFTRLTTIFNQIHQCGYMLANTDACLLKYWLTYPSLSEIAMTGQYEYGDEGQSYWVQYPTKLTFDSPGDEIDFFESHGVLEKLQNCYNDEGDLDDDSYQDLLKELYLDDLPNISDYESRTFNRPKDLPTEITRIVDGLNVYIERIEYEPVRTALHNLIDTFTA